jgi:group I intron endonuclease
MWKNLNNGKQYIGSSEKLRRRFREYFNINHLLNNKSMYICNSLFKHGYSNFSLTILKYCEVAELLIREKHYWDVFTPEYNISQDPTAPMSGRYSFWWYKKKYLMLIKEKIILCLDKIIAMKLKQ